MFKKSAPVLLLGGALLAVSFAATAQDSGKGASKGGTTSIVPTLAGGGKVSIPSLIERYTPLTGSVGNATSLVNGLHTGGEITLVGTAPAPSTSSTSPTGPAAGPSGPAGPGGPAGPAGPMAAPPPPPPPPTATFTSPTGPESPANRDIALALRESVLTHTKIATPSPTQIQAALVNANSGVLTLRAKGMGWGEIAKSLGFELK